MSKLILYFYLLTTLVITSSNCLNAQTPTLTNATPVEGFIGEQVCFPITFVNAGAPGYGPYVRLILPPEVTFDNASFAGAAQTIQNLGTIVTTAPNNFVIDPIATSNTSTTTNDTIFAPTGSTVILLEYPVGSMVTGGVSLITELCVTVDATAPIGVPVDICVQGMYEFGDTPTGDNGAIAATPVCEPIIPILFRFDKEIDGSDGIFEEVPGSGPVPCHPHQYQLNIDIAAAGTLNGPITITDILPGELSYLGNISLPPGCTAVEPTVGGQGGTLTITCTGTYNGSTSNVDMQVTFDAAVSDTLDETICDFLDIENNASVAVPGSPTQRDTVGTHVEHINLGHGNNAGGPVAIGATVGYTINFDITEYTAGVSAAVITFVVADGMEYLPASLTWNGVAVPLAAQTIVAGPGNGSTVTVDVHAQNGANITGCGSPSLQYNANVRETYGNGDPVLSRDRLTHSSTLTYDLVEGASGCTDGAGTPIEIVDISFQKTVLNSPPTGPGRNGQWWPGDIVTYQLELRVPSLDLDDVVITDFFPLPIHDVADLAATFGTDVVFGAGNCWPNPPITYTRDIPTNSLILDFGDLSNSVTGGCIDIVLEISIPITTIPFADGLFHSNFMQVNSDNSNGDDVTNNQLTLIQVAAPDLELTKGIVSSSNAGVTISPVVSPPDGDATGANAGDQLTFNINVTNIGSSPGHDVQIRDVAPPELTNCMLTAPTPVTDGTGTAIPFTGNFAGNSLTIDITNPINFTGAAGSTDVINVSYVCDVVSGIESGTEFDNTAEVDWSSTSGGVKFPPVDDMASVTTANPTMNKNIDYIYPNYSGNNTQASIGEVVAYELQINIPEGNMNNVSLVDRLDAGLAFVGVDSIIICSSSGSANITTSVGGGFAAVQSGAVISNTGAGAVNQDRELTLDFGNLQNSDTDNINDTIKVFYRTIVINDVINVDGVQRNNRADVIWDDPNNPGSTLNIRETAPNITIVEPQLQITKSFTPDEVLPGNNSFVTITVRNLPTSSAPAFDVNLTDILPTGMIFVSGFSEGGTASITTPANHAGGTITAHLDTINVGEIYSITFEVGVSSAITPCFTLSNCANITWESIAQADEASMPSAFSSPLGIKRSGNPGAPGGAANTYTQDSCADLDVVIDNTFDPFITANTPLCEGSRAVLSVQQYSGNVVTYNWTGPGVPANFNNYELVIDPVTSADTGTYFVYVELDGCTTDTSNFFVLQLRPQPGAPNISPGDTTVCEGESIQFSTDSIATVYNWTGPNGFTANSATTPLIVPVDLADAGTYTLITTNSQGCSSAPATVDLTVTPRPIRPSIANNTPVCSGEDLVLSSSTTATTYRWIAPNGQDTITTSNTLNLSASSNLYLFGNWTLAVTDASGCESEPSLSSSVVINATPNPPVTSNSGPICEGQDLSLTVNSVSGATYAWYSDENLTNLVASSQNPTISGLLATNSPDTFFVQINSNGCLSDTGFTEVLINSNPAAFTPNYTSILCSGDTLMLFANTTATSYNWIGPNGFVSNIENPFIANSSAVNAGTYSVSITDANGCTNSGLVQVAVDERPNTPNITSNGTICEGQDIILTVSGYTGTTVQYMWNTPTGPITTTVPNLTINNATVADSGIYGLVVTVDGCTSLADSINVAVNTNPVAPNVPADFAVCENGSISLTTNTSANVYQWTGPNGFNSNSPNPPTINPVSSVHAGTYNLVVTDFNGCTSPTSSVVVTVNPAPARPALTTNSAICAGEDLVLSTTATASNYIWIAPNGADTTTTTDEVTIVSSSLLYQAGNWTLVVEDANGCQSAAAVASNVEINTTPASARPSNNGPVCNNSMAQLSAGTIAGASYSWSTDRAGNNVFSTLQNPMVNVLNNDSTFYLLVTINGCTATVDSTTVTVIPQATAPNVPADFAVCEGESITLTSSTIANSYQWTGPNGFTSTQQNPAVITNANSNNTGTYTLVVRDANGCESAPATVVVTVNPAPARPALTTNSAICAGEDLVLSTTATASNYIWIAPNGADTTTTTDNVTIVSSSLLYQAGNWTLVVEDANGCQSAAAVASNVEINTTPASARPSNNGPVCNNSMAQLSAGTIAGASYSWSTDRAGNNVFSTLQNPMVNVLNNDSTFYLLVTTNGCTATVDSTTVTVIPQATAPNVPADFAVCEGESITLTSSTVANSYQWTGPNGFTSTQQNPAVITNANSNNAGTYTLVVRDANGCESAPATVVVTVNPAPARPALTTNSAICAGEDLVLSTTATASNYIWIAPNGADTTTTTDDVTIVSSSLLYQAGNWTLVVEDANGCQSVQSVASNVEINNTVTPVAFNNGSVCIGDAVMLSTTTVSGALYQWYSDAALTNLISTQQNPTINNIISDSTFFLVVTVNGCSSTAVSTTVTLHPRPSTPAVPADFAVCEGDDIRLTTTTIANMYNWTGPNGFSSMQQNPMVISPSTTADAGTYTLFITDVNGCESADTTVVVTVNSAPAAPVLTNNSAICTGDTLILSTTANADTFRWTAPNGLDTFTLVNNLMIVPTNTTFYQSGDWTLITQVGNNCPSLMSNPSSVVINSAATAPTAYNNGPVCIGGTVTLSTPSAPGAFYQWYTDATLTNLIATTATVNVPNINTDSTFYLVVTVSGCTSPAGSTTVTVINQPAPPAVPADFAVCEGGDIILTTSTNASAYNWTGPNGFSSNQQNPPVITNATYIDSGDYRLFVTFANGCVSADTIVHVSVNANPPVPVITSNSPLCFGDTLRLTSSTSCGQSQWIGPNGNSAGTLGTPGGNNVLWTLGSSTNIPMNNANYLPGNWSMVCIDTMTGCRTESTAITVEINTIPDSPIINNNGPVCMGGNAQFTTASVANATYAWYSDMALTNLVSTQQNPMLMNLTTDTTWYLVVTVNGCSSVAGNSTILVYPVPTTPSVPADFAVCEGESISLSTSTNASGYNWTGPNGFTSNLQNPTVITNATFADSGVYTLSIVDANGCSSLDTTLTVTVNGNPTQPILTSNSSICVGEDLVLSTTSTAANYMWIAPNGADTVTTTANATIPSSSTLYQAGDWTLVLTDVTGCSSASSVATTVEINAIPATPIINNNGPVCIRGNAQFTTASVANATYAWYSDMALTNLVSTQQNPMLMNLTTDTTWYLVVTVNGCSSVAGNSTILVHPVPTTPSVPADFAVCEGESISLGTSTVANAYFWTGPNGFNSSQRFPLVIQQATVADSGSYNLYIIDGNGCQSMDTTVHVTVNPNPANPVITYNGPLCFGDTLTITSSGDCGQSQWIGPNGNSAGTLGTPGGNNVLWTFGTTTNIPSTDANYLAGDWYMVCIDTMTGCRSESNTVNVEINPIPIVSAFNNGPICAGENGELSATFIAGANYAWYSDATLTTLVSTSRTPIISNMMASATYYVQATVNGCTSLADSTMIVVNPTPVVPTPSYTPLCQLDTLFLFANATGPIAMYGWTGPNGFNSHLENPIIPNIYPFNAGSYVLTVIDSFGCEASSTVEVTIYPKPQTPTITHNAPFCENTTDLTLYTQAYFGTDVRYFWTLPDGTMDTTLVPSLIVPNAMVSDTGLYSLVVFVDGCLSLPGEEDIVIYPTPATPNIPADFAVCEGGDIVLTTTTSAADYFWTGPNGFQSNLPSPSVVAATTVDSGTYSLYITNTWGCQSADTSVEVTVNANPPAPVITSNTPLCFGDTLTITSSGDCGQSQWIGPNGNSAGTLGTPGGGNVLWTMGSTTNIPSTDPNYLSGNWYMVCIDTITGCRSESNTISVDITPIPDTPAVFNNSPICIGESVELTTASITGASYAWYADSTMTTLVATNQNPTITNITTDSTFYLAITVNGCTSELGSTLVTIHPIPTTPAIPADFAVCEGDNIVLTTTTTAAGYFWTGPNGFNSGLQNPSVVNSTVIDSGDYTLYIVDANGCVSDDTTVNVRVNPNPTQPVLSSNSAICEGDDLVLSTTATAANYMWIAPNGADTITTMDTLVIGTTDPFYQDGDWTLIIIDANGCQSVLSNREQVTIHSIPSAQAVFNSGPVCNGDDVNLFTSFINGATYAWYADSTMTTLVATSQNPTIRDITTDSIFYLFITVNGCTSLAGSTTVQVYPTPITPNVPANITVCEGEAVVLTTTTNAASYFWTGPNGFNSNQQNPTAIANATVLDSGAYNLFIIDANGCRSGDTSVAIIVNPTPSQPFIATNNTPICEGDDVVLTVNTAAGATYEWFNSAGVSVGVGQVLTITAATTADAGDYYVVTTLNGCNSVPSDLTTVLIDVIPTTMPFAGNDINLCDEFNTTLEATPVNGATGTWTTTSGATIVNPNTYNTAVYNLPTGSSTFYWTLSNGACLDYAVDSMVVDVTPASGELADAGLDQSICGQTMATLAAATPTISTGVWTQSSAQASQGIVIANPTNPNSTVSGLQQGNSYVFTWTLSNGNCMDHSSDQVIIDVDVAPPDVAYAGQDIAICNSNTTTLAAFSSQYGTGFWTTASGATIIDPTNPNTPIVNLTANDTSVFYWTLSNGTCLDYSTDSVLVVVSTASDVADAGVNQVVCGQSSLNLAATAPTFGIGTWTQTSSQAAQGINIIDPNDPATLITGLQQGNTYTFTWTLTNGTCVDYDSDNTIVTITTSPPDNAYAGADINLCGNTTTTLAAAVPSVANGTWSTTSTAVITNPTLPNSTVANLPIGTSVFVWSLSSGSCIDYDDDTLVITVTQPSGDIADAGLDTAYCAQNAINLQGTAPSVGLGYWSQTPAQAGLGVVINDINDPNTLVTGLLAGRVYTFTWTLTNGGCVDYSSDDVLITIDVFPNDVAYAGEDTVLCGGNTLHLGATVPPIGTGLWTTNDSATIVDPSIASSEVVFILQDTTTYYWTLTNGACVDYSTDSVQVVLAPVSSDIATAGFDQTLCGVDSIVLNGSVPTTSTGVWTQPNNQASQGVVITNPNDPTSSVTGLQVGNTYYFEWTLSTTGCPNFSTDDVNYTINALPTEVAYAGPDIILCDDDKTNMAANIPTNSTGVWSTNSSSIIINPTLPTTSVVNLATDTTELYWTLSNGSCVDYSVDTMIVIAAPTTIDPADAGLDLAICNDSTGVITAVSPTIATGIWTQTAAQTSLGVSIVDPTNPSTTVTGLMPDNEYTFTWTLSSGPCIDYDTDDAIVEVSRLPKDNAYGGKNMVICGINNTTIAATPPTIGTGEWTTTTGAVIVNPTEATTEVLDLNLGSNVFIWSISNGACRDYSIDTLLVTIDNAPIANDDSIAVLYNADIDPVSVITNDSLNSSWRIDLVTPPAKGTATNLNDGSFEIATPDILATQQFTYRLCNPACPDRFCDTAQVTIKIQGGFDCKVPNVITPNKDEINDVLFIPCLENYPDTKLLIFNRWGDQVYFSDNYQNNWDGTHNGQPSPDGTYYYIMILATGDEFQGFVEVRR